MLIRVIPSVVMALSIIALCSGCASQPLPPEPVISQLDYRPDPKDPNCWNYTAQATVEGRPQRIVGHACRQPDGTWRIAEGTLPWASSQAGIAVENTAQRDNADPQQPWRWTIFLSGSPSEIAGVRCVTYHLHPTFRVPDRRICTPREDPRHAFPFSAESWAPFTVSVDIEHADGTVDRTSHKLAFASPSPGIQSQPQTQSSNLAQIKDLQNKIAKLEKVVAAHTKIVERLLNAADRNEQEQKDLEKRIERIEEHLEMSGPRLND